MKIIPTHPAHLSGGPNFWPCGYTRLGASLGLSCLGPSLVLCDIYIYELLLPVNTTLGSYYSFNKCAL
jgi:hypothetical protein